MAGGNRPTAYDASGDPERGECRLDRVGGGGAPLLLGGLASDAASVVPGALLLDLVVEPTAQLLKLLQPCAYLHAAHAETSPLRQP